MLVVLQARRSEDEIGASVAATEGDREPVYRATELLLMEQRRVGMEG